MTEVTGKIGNASVDVEPVNNTMNKSSFSLTQSGNIGVLIGMIMLVLNYFQINILESEVQIIVGAVASIIGVIASWTGRYRIGDLTFVGFRKK